MADISIDEIKVKFQKLQSETQKLKEEKVKYEAQLNTLKEQYDAQLKTLLEATGTSTLAEAVAVCKQKQSELNSLKESLQQTLDKYLGSVDNMTKGDVVLDSLESSI